MKSELDSLKQAAEYLEDLRGSGPVGVLATIGLAAGYTAEDWPTEYRSDVARIGFWAVISSLVWVALIVIYRVTGWPILRYLETARPRDD